MKPVPLANLAQLAEFDEIIDVRSPGEYTDDHIPGALNFPVMDDAERARVGTIYKQVSAFDAKKIGAALVSRNIARHLEDYFADKPRGWKPLIYCWRGGGRSGSLAHVLKQIGFGAAQLDGGYKTYRRAVVAELDSLPGRFDFRVVCGPTGSGKSRLLQALLASGAQVLDLEGLAAHRGSVLGNLPDASQPPQKMFDSQLWWALQHFNPGRPVYVEAESKKIGLLRVPDALLARMREGGCVRVEVATPLRVALLKEEYAHFLANPAALKEKLDCLLGLYGQEIIARWNALAEQGAWDELVLALPERHYDPAYGKSTLKNYPHYTDTAPIVVENISPTGFLSAAQRILEQA
ncbi:tRNA 2-selenouridine(34) synthase MnmH [Sulfuriferula plumbiphila]|uniref:tRNA 2-selenouridine(34) synthase MnmH n=1 Tax=Sulfuriferula plumbiphila TaxID=171865 RepID=UPI00135CFB64|nr:tRNA 2-selenouridine(34) synthase MnmH [Sulfuriferula plumbiphila]BBP04539.1 tRNA 2-selenouridine synthase [Sulfuriferula plumbiphila]